MFLFCVLCFGVRCSVFGVRVRCSFLLWGIIGEERILGCSSAPSARYIECNALICSIPQAPLPAPLLMLPKTLHKDAIRAFKAIQLIMGDREAPASMSGSGSLRSTASQVYFSLGSFHMW